MGSNDLPPYAPPPLKSKFTPSALAGDGWGPSGGPVGLSRGRVGLLRFSLVLWVQGALRCEYLGVPFESQSVVSEVSVPPLTRPQLAEARRMRAVELFEQGRPHAQIAGMLGVCPESVRRWKRQ
ncbi:helix-turn-helix domain-containing protein, partial [Streptomyces asiaticus]